MRIPAAPIGGIVGGSTHGPRGVCQLSLASARDATLARRHCARLMSFDWIERAGLLFDFRR
jgi:hypothetical protein